MSPSPEYSGSIKARISSKDRNRPDDMKTCTHSTGSLFVSEIRHTSVARQLRWTVRSFQSKLLADQASKALPHFSMPRNRSLTSIRRIEVDIMPPAVAMQPTTCGLQLSNQVAAFHSSRSIASSLTCTIAETGSSSSRIRRYASRRFSSSSSSDSPWLNTPGTSFKRPTYQPSSTQNSMRKGRCITITRGVRRSESAKDESTRPFYRFNAADVSKISVVPRGGAAGHEATTGPAGLRPPLAAMIQRWITTSDPTPSRS